MKRLDSDAALVVPMKLRSKIRRGGLYSSIACYFWKARAREIDRVCKAIDEWAEEDPPRGGSR